MTDMPSRREGLIVGALRDGLGDAEGRELDQLRLADPLIDIELEELRTTALRLSAVDMAWLEGSPPAGLQERILSVISGTAPPNHDWHKAHWGTPHLDSGHE